MANDPYSVTSSTQSNMRRTPIWIPNPAVPVVARVLTYCFWSLMGFTMWLSFTITRPPDVPNVPTLPLQWKTFQSPLGYSIPYPADWTVDHSSRGAIQDDTLFSLSERSNPPVFIDIEAKLLNSPYEALSVPGNNNQTFENSLRHSFQDYQRGDNIAVDAVSSWHLFYARNKTNSVEITGAWRVAVFGRCVIYLLAAAPSDGWENMRKILGYMVDNTRVAQM